MVCKIERRVLGPLLIRWIQHGLIAAPFVQIQRGLDLAIHAYRNDPRLNVLVLLVRQVLCLGQVEVHWNVRAIQQPTVHHFARTLVNRVRQINVPYINQSIEFEILNQLVILLQRCESESIVR